LARIDTEQRMHNPARNTDKRKTICVFCGSSMGHGEEFAAAARRMGTLIGEAGFAFLFGGGSLGLMGEAARAARDEGAPILGILPEFLRHLEPPLKSAEELVITPDLYQRKERMLVLGDAFVILSGGLGTLDEFFEVLTSAQLGVHQKPIIVVNTAGFYDPLKALLDHVVSRGFARKEIAALFTMVETPDEAMAVIRQALAAAPVSL
jgi:uncharacterized protein (TIGR00730 family)